MATRFLRLGAILSCLGLIHGVQAVGAEPAFPPGVRLLDPIPAANSIPPDFQIDGIEVDWTDPLLAVRLELSLQGKDSIAPLWDQAAAGSAQSVRIQLAEPVWDGASFKLALEAELRSETQNPNPAKNFVIDPEPKPTAPSGQTNSVRIGGPVPWLVDGPAVRADPDPGSPLGGGSSRVDVRWLGRPADWKTPPQAILKGRFVMSALDPATGRCGFFLIASRRGGRIRAAGLNGWIEKAFAPRIWLAVHGMGPQAVVSQGPWRLGAREPSRVPDRAGAVLVLDRVAPGEPVDWARAGEVSIRASSFDPNHPPASVVSGLLGSSPLSPSVWASLPPGPDVESPAWIELEWAEPRLVEEIRLVWAEAAGWSEQFNPDSVRVIADFLDARRRAEPIELNHPDRAVSTIRFPNPRGLASLRIEFLEPRRFGIPGPARLAAIQAMGPYE